MLNAIRRPYLIPKHDMDTLKMEVQCHVKQEH